MVKITTNPDKTISIDGKKTFITGIMGSTGKNFTDINSVKTCKDFYLHWSLSPTDFTKTTLLPIYHENGNIFTRPSWDPIDEILRTDLNFAGWAQCDEPIGNNTTTLNRSTEASCLAEPKRCRTPTEWRNGKCYYGDETPYLSAKYAQWHGLNDGHPVFLNIWHDAEHWLPYCDILSWDNYTFGSGGWGIDWTRDDAVYAWEIMAEINIFKTAITKPTMAVIIGLGKDFHSTAPAVLWPLTPKEMRCNTYSAICTGVQGIIVWSQYIERTVNGIITDVGLGTNLALHAYYSQLMRELKSLNDILTSSTLAYSFHGHIFNPVGVAFSNAYEKVVHNHASTNFSYILKDGPDGKYLIVVNKDTRPITTDIKIPVQSGVATLLGMETTGSAKSGRTVPIIDSTIKDTFDGLAVHIYNLVEVTPPCTPNWQCEPELTGFEVDGCGNKRPNPLCNPVQTQSTLYVISIPTGATIIINDSIIGVTPAHITLESGHYVVKATISNQTLSDEFDIVPGQTLTKIYTFGKEESTLSMGLLTIPFSMAVIVNRLKNINK